MQINEGDMVVCYFKDKGPKLIRVRENGEMNTKHGKLSYSRMIGRPYGATITTSVGHPVYLLRPTAEDLAMGVRRISNINYPKDISRILYRIGIKPGARVIEIGAGSGAMAISLAYAVGNEGRVYTYDIREDMLKCTGKNLRRVGLADRVALKLRDKKAQLSESEVDAVLMDIPTPWEELDAAWDALCCGGYLACTVPTYDQLGELAICLSKKSFMPLEAMEIMCRPLRAERGRTRPEFKMITHTQMIQFAVKILPAESCARGAADDADLGINDDENDGF
jgi:tRNA (adenine57-N1/adenine58-N1)-methyltransferase